MMQFSIYFQNICDFTPEAIELLVDAGILKVKN